MNQEAQIEKQFIEKLESLKYTYRSDIHDLDSLQRNFREKFERLNMVSLTDGEFDRLLEEIVTADVFKASKRLRTKQTFIREDGTPLPYSLVNLRDWCKNDYEVVNQLKINTANSYHRYDVVILVNGLPLVQMELKSHKISPLKAVEQIVEYKKDHGNGYTNTIMCFMQLFMCSNGESNTIYFANNNNEHFQFDATNSYLPVYNAALRDNKKVVNLFDFADLMLHKCTLGRLISRYMVLVETEQKMLVMRPYQIYAVEDIIDTVAQGKGNGCIWHTTGSGKTLTSFKASTLLKDDPNIDKCIFVVDRKDLDKQTREEFNRFQAGCVEQNENTRVLVYRLMSDDYADKVIVTTIQKLGLALDPSKNNPYYTALKELSNKRVVFIFDECHRGQFGENRKAIENFFPKAQLFGFTGTPIFEENSNYTRYDGTLASRVTTLDVFQQMLHTYTITHAIQDRNVLRFNVEYYGLDNNGTRVAAQPTRKQIVKNVLEIHDKVTANRRFNALFVADSIDEAIRYYENFKQAQQALQEADPDYVPLNIATVFTPPYTKYDQEDLQQEQADNKVDPDGKKQQLEQIIAEYNEKFNTAFSVALFDEYYKDVQQRIKDQKYPNKLVPHDKKLDIVIVVEMMLTGFDSKFLNTLYVDRNLKYHQLIQAYSRTNRILDGTKPYGNIICYRDLQDATDEAMLLFSGYKDLTKAKEYWIVEPADTVIQQYQEKVQALEAVMGGMGLDCRPEEVVNIPDGENAVEFVEAFKDVQRLRLQLDQYVDLTAEQKDAIEQTLPSDTLNSFRTAYLDMAHRTPPVVVDPPEPGMADLFQPDYELSLFSSALIDYDYIMKLLARYTGTKKTRMKLTKEQLLALLSQNSNLMDEREYLAAFISEEIEKGSGLTEEEIRQRYEEFKSEKIGSQIADISAKYGIESATLDAFVRESVRLMRIDEEVLSGLFASMGWKERKHAKEGILTDLKPLFDRLSNGQKIEGLSGYVKQ